MRCRSQFRTPFRISRASYAVVVGGDVLCRSAVDSQVFVTSRRGYCMDTIEIASAIVMELKMVYAA